MSSISTVLDHFRLQVSQHPHAPALVDERRTLSYAELDKRSDAVADFLIKRGVTPGDFVPLLAGRSQEFIVGLLGVVKTGAAYVPIDETYPLLRQQYIVEQTGASLALSTAGSSEIGQCECIAVQACAVVSDSTGETARQVSDTPF